MSQFRRQDDRRRRVLMTAASTTAARTSGVSRNRLESMREARRPTLAYGTRVREGLRARWFSLVPVERAALAKLLATLAVIVAALVLMNDATVRFSSIQRHPALVGVFQINQLGSLGRYWIGVMYLALAGAAWMVYQLRRFRNDDFRGNYRLWQWIVAASLVASIATSVPLLAMLGAMLELLMGRRIALSGHDWIGLFLVVGGAVLALRSISEMWRYRTSLTLLIGGWVCVTVPVAAQWNIVAIDTNLRWSVVTAAPLLAVTLWFAATASYLRSLYREVRGIEPSIGMLQRLRDTVAQRSARREATAPSTSPATARATTARKSVSPPAAEKPSSGKRGRSPATTKTETEHDSDQDSERGAAPAKRRWFGLLPSRKAHPGKSNPAHSDAATTTREAKRTVVAKPKDAPVEDDLDRETDPDGDHRENDPENTSPTKPAAPPSQRWWQRLGSLSKAKPKPKPKAKTKTKRDSRRSDSGAAQSPGSVEATAVAETATEESAAKESATEAASQPKKRRFGLGSMMKRRGGDQADSHDDGQPSSPNDSAKAAAKRPAPSDSDDDDDHDIDDDDNESDDDIDWSSMNKAERRRMRKQLKRGSRAA